MCEHLKPPSESSELSAGKRSAYFKQRETLHKFYKTLGEWGHFRSLDGEQSDTKEVSHRENQKFRNHRTNSVARAKRRQRFVNSWQWKCWQNGVK
jgi:hypothetical protein